MLAGALITMALGAIGAALAHGFDELLTSVVVIGLGFGCTDFSLNSLLVRASEVGLAPAGSAWLTPATASARSSDHC